MEKLTEQPQTGKKSSKELTQADTDEGGIEIYLEVHLFWWLLHTGGKFFGSCETSWVIYIYGKTYLDNSKNSSNIRGTTVHWLMSYWKKNPFSLGKIFWI